MLSGHTQIELALLRHAESLTQWIPHVALMIGLLSTLAVYVRPAVPTLRVFQAVMLIFLIVGALGVYLHFQGNVEFALERPRRVAEPLVGQRRRHRLDPVGDPHVFRRAGL